MSWDNYLPGFKMKSVIFCEYARSTGSNSVRLQGLLEDMAAAVIVNEQTLSLEGGLYELTAHVTGGGRVTLRIGKFERSAPLSATGASMGCWQTGQGARRCAVEGEGDGQIKDLAVQKATPEHQQDWNRQEEEYNRFGFMVFSAQRPLPKGQSASQAVGRELEHMTDRVVFFDPRLDTATQVKNVARLVDWLKVFRINSMELACHRTSTYLK